MFLPNQNAKINIKPMDSYFKKVNIAYISIRTERIRRRRNKREKKRNIFCVRSIWSVIICR